jgi:excisionase family DNA binding protein
MERPLTTEEAAEELGYHVNHVRRLLRAGTLEGERVGGLWLIDREEVERVRAQQGKGGRLPRSEEKQWIG